MRPFSAQQLCTLAEAYCAATGEPLSTLSERVTEKTNNKLFGRLADGFSCTLDNAERASVWFAKNWPEGVSWPRGVPAPADEAA
jgi:hypothetical protein